ncbi:MAG: PspA/IM30 family protein [Anaerolineae bacterium]|nr:PspA/IM30 family protein [Anaerolineae bacterium]
MAQTILGKIQILISATLHSIVDNALRQNSLAVFDDYIRQAENSMATLRAALSDMTVSVKTLKRKYDESANEAASLDIAIDQALKQGKNTVAKALQTKLNAQLDIARTYQDQFEKQQRTTAILLEVTQVLQAKVDVLEEQRDQVKTLLELIKSKRIVAKSIKEVQDITDGRTQEIIEDVRSKLDQADARLEVATSRLSTEIEEEVDTAGVEAQLEERRARLGLS